MMKALIEESAREIKLPRPMGVGGYKYNKNRGCGHCKACYSLRLLRYVYGCEDDMQSDQRYILRNNRKKRKRRFTKDERYIPIASVSYSPPSLSWKLETLVLMMGSSSESSRTFFDPSSKDKSASSPQVVELGMEDGVATKEEPSFMAQERVMKGLLTETTRGVEGEALPIWDVPVGVTSF